MSQRHQIEAKSKVLADSVTQITRQIGDGLHALADLQRRLLVLTAPDAALDATTFDPAPDSADGKLLASMKVHGGAADLVDQTAQLMAALGQGVGGQALDHRQSMFDAAAGRFEAMKPDDLPNVAKDKEETDKESKEAHFADPKTARQAKLDVIGAKAFGALGMVAKMAGKTNVGRLSGLVYIIGEHVEKGVDLKKGQDALAQLVPDVGPDFARLVEVLEEGAPEFADAADEMVDRAVAWSNDHRPQASDPARLSYDLHVAGMIADARSIRVTFEHCAAGLKSVGPAFKEIQGLLSGEGKEDGSSHDLARTVGGDLHALAKVRIF